MNVLEQECKFECAGKRGGLSCFRTYSLLYTPIHSSLEAGGARLFGAKSHMGIMAGNLTQAVNIH